MLVPRVDVARCETAGNRVRRALGLDFCGRVHNSDLSRNKRIEIHNQLNIDLKRPFHMLSIVAPNPDDFPGVGIAKLWPYLAKIKCSECEMVFCMQQT